MQINNNNNITWSNVTVYKGKESEQAVPLENRIKEALQKSQKYGLLGTDALNDITKKIAAYVNKVESAPAASPFTRGDDVIGLSINDDGSIAVEIETPSDSYSDGRFGSARKRQVRTEIIQPFSITALVEKKKLDGVQLKKKKMPGSETELKKLREAARDVAEEISDSRKLILTEIFED